MKSKEKGGNGFRFQQTKSVINRRLFCIKEENALFTEIIQKR